MLRARRIPPPHIFPPDPWALEATRFGPELAGEFVGQAETMFALSNGRLGIRGMLDEGAPVEEPGVYLNGFHELRPITYGERAYGFPRVGQSMLGLPDGTPMRLYVEGEPFQLDRAEVRSFRRRLDMRSGVLERHVAWRAPAGQCLTLRTRRLVSFDDRHLAAIGWELSVEDGAAEITLCSELVLRPPLPADPEDPRLAEPFAGRRVLCPTGQEATGLRAILGFRTEGSGLVLACAMDHAVEDPERLAARLECKEDCAVVRFRGEVAPGRPIRLWKALAYYYDGGGVAPEEVRARAALTLDRALERGFDGVLERQRMHVARFWERADVELEDADPHRQQVVRWNLFQLLQASERAEGHGIGARGLTGRTYEGHYFWDTEIYVLPFLIYTNPRMARSLLMFRHGMLDKARERARELNHRGATFPWRTIDGREASAYYAAGTAQYHINADIAYALRKYVEVAGDEEFLLDYGAEILVETARLWHDLGFFSPRRGGRFCINAVTGPDEYNTVVNNNLFTNLMARENLRYAADTAEAMRRDHPDAFAELVRRTGLKDSEPVEWREAAERMYLPWDELLRIHPQDDEFLYKERWDFANTPADHYPLMLHYHPLNLYRAQVIKQADTVLAMFLLNGQFTPEEKKRNFDYYDPITTHDSSLSVCIQAIVAAEIGYATKAMEYFRFAAEMDLSDVGGNMRHGAHIASIGGTWMALTYGFAGLRDGEGRISFSPRLPSEWRALRFPLTIRGCRLRVEVRHDVTTYRLEAGDELTVFHCGEAVTLSAAAPVATRPTPPPPPEPVPEFPQQEPPAPRRG
ncbi:kojibiose phosphorylase [Caldovatus sediminis]|uniref:Kojibiose phosphorylase n=1 Tax=Caldovatus sediminis TaxID=2041189 RepID=A0A8J2ZAX3_9PROT|nr:glycoside hydrolase family 65 protein [Caldovatus sediminis]GGG29417.1 kojibiose phosphorylase [Caldovatus sediminis]